jgi:hypothetical protein
MKSASSEHFIGQIWHFGPLLQDRNNYCHPFHRTNSAKLAPGRYRDQLRVVTASGLTSYQLVGFIEVRPSF